MEPPKVEEEKNTKKNGKSDDNNDSKEVINSQDAKKIDDKDVEMKIKKDSKKDKRSPEKDNQKGE